MGKKKKREKALTTDYVSPALNMYRSRILQHDRDAVALKLAKQMEKEYASSCEIMVAGGCVVAGNGEMFQELLHQLSKSK